MSPQCLQLTGLSVDMIGTFVLTAPLFRKAEDIYKQTMDIIGGNPYLKVSFYRDRRFALGGIALVVIGFAKQLAAIIPA